MLEKYWLDFWCNACEETFVSEPDGTGYEQAKCPKCSDLCQSYESEYVEAKTLFSQGADANSCMGCIFSIALLGPLLGSVFGPFFASKFSATSEDDLPPILRNPESEPTSTVIARLENIDDSETLVEMLHQRGIIGEIAEPKENSEGATFYEISVPRRDAEQAKRLVP